MSSDEFNSRYYPQTNGRPSAQSNQASYAPDPSRTFGYFDAPANGSIANSGAHYNGQVNGGQVKGGQLSRDVPPYDNAWYYGSTPSLSNTRDLSTSWLPDASNVFSNASLRSNRPSHLDTSGLETLVHMSELEASGANVTSYASRPNVPATSTSLGQSPLDIRRQNAGYISPYHLNNPPISDMHRIRNLWSDTDNGDSNNVGSNVGNNVMPTTASQSTSRYQSSQDSQIRDTTSYLSPAPPNGALRFSSSQHGIADQPDRSSRLNSVGFSPSTSQHQSRPSPFTNSSQQSGHEGSLPTRQEYGRSPLVTQHSPQTHSSNHTRPASSSFSAPTHQPYPQRTGAGSGLAQSHGSLQSKSTPQRSDSHQAQQQFMKPSPIQRPVTEPSPSPQQLAISAPQLPKAKPASQPSKAAPKPKASNNARKPFQMIPGPAIANQSAPSHQRDFVAQPNQDQRKVNPSPKPRKSNAVPTVTQDQSIPMLANSSLPPEPYSPAPPTVTKPEQFKKSAPTQQDHNHSAAPQANNAAQRTLNREQQMPQARQTQESPSRNYEARAGNGNNARPGTAGQSSVSSHTLENQDDDSEMSMEAQMRTMIEKMRQYQAKDPMKFLHVWEQVKKGTSLNGPALEGNQAPKSIEWNANMAQSSSPAPENRPPASKDPPMQPSHRSNTQRVESPTLPGTVGEARSTRKPETAMAQPVNLPSQVSRPVAPHATVPSAVARPERPRAEPLYAKETGRPSSQGTKWPPTYKKLLANTAAGVLNAAPENAGKYISGARVEELLDQNPNYPQLCDSLERAGFTVRRAAFARVLLDAVPDPATTPSESTGSTQSTLHVAPTANARQEGRPPQLTSQTHQSQPTPTRRSFNLLSPGPSPSPPPSMAAMLPGLANHGSNGLMRERSSIEHARENSSPPVEISRDQTRLVESGVVGQRANLNPQSQPRQLQVPSGAFHAPVNRSHQINSAPAANVTWQRSHQSTPRQEIFLGVQRPIKDSPASKIPGRQTMPSASSRQSATPSTISKEQAARKRAFDDIVDLTQDASDDEDAAYAVKRPHLAYQPQVNKDVPFASGQKSMDRHATATATATATHPPPRPSVNALANASANASARPSATPSANISQRNTPSASVPIAVNYHNPLKDYDVIRPLDKRLALRKAAYDPDTIARDVLIATGRHPNERALNDHLLPLKRNFTLVNNASDLSTFNWDLVDPATPAANQHIASAFNEDTVARNQTDDMTALDANTVATPRRPSPMRIAHNADEFENLVDMTQTLQKPQSVGSTPRKRGRPPKSSHSGSGTPTSTAGNDPRPEEIMNQGLASGIGNLPPPPHVSELSTPKRRGRPPKVRDSGSASGNESGNGSSASSAPSGQQNMPRKRGRPVGSGGKSSSGKLSRTSSNVQASMPNRSHSQTDLTPSRPSGLRHTTFPSDNVAVVIESHRNDESSNSQRATKATRQRSSRRSEPTYRVYNCQWKECKAELHNLETLRKHVKKAHCTRAVHGGIPCWWAGCGRRKENEDRYKMKGKSEYHALDFSTEEAWDEHMNKEHLGRLSWDFGDGPSAGIKDDDSETEHLSDNTGHRLTRRASASSLATTGGRGGGRDDDDATGNPIPPGSMPNAAFNRLHGNKTPFEKMKEVERTVIEKKKAAGPGIDKQGSSLRTWARIRAFVEDDTYMEAGADESLSDDGERMDVD
ncbi:MAG: hypothetical protein M1819_004432 [Sarea resinae]|nr:MAG: hypothetical protein M1819_004432 [Sarea resinae]